jgi:acetyl esterase/lipase
MDMMRHLDPELVEPLEEFLAATGGGFKLSDIAGLREMLDGMIAGMQAEAPVVEGVASEDVNVPCGSPEDTVLVRIYRPSAASKPLPALIWMHPGGFVVGSIELDDLMLREIARDVGCAVIAVEYRLAPEHPYPAPLDDCNAVLQWASANAKSLRLDPNKLAVGGASAGGGLAAGVALRARDRGGAQPCFQLLIYPAINDSNIDQVSNSVPENLFWSRENALIGWQSYLGGKQASEAVDVYAAASRATDLAGLPPAFVAVGSIDMFVHDCLDYSSRLIKAGVDTALCVYPGAFHAFDAFAPQSSVAQRFVMDRNAALRRAFA